MSTRKRQLLEIAAILLSNHAGETFTDERLLEKAQEIDAEIPVTQEDVEDLLQGQTYVVRLPDGTLVLT